MDNTRDFYSFNLGSIPSKPAKFEDVHMDFSADIIITESGCHEWQKSCSSAGYAQKTINGKYWSLHRYVYQLKDPTLCATDVVRHLCHNRKCINPSHLEKGSHADNWNDSKDKHLEASKLKRRNWCICGTQYKTVREASAMTGIHQQTLCKYTQNGIFDVTAYRKGCYAARVKPKV